MLVLLYTNIHSLTHTHAKSHSWSFVRCLLNSHIQYKNENESIYIYRYPLDGVECITLSLCVSKLCHTVFSICLQTPL